MGFIKAKLEKDKYNYISLENIVLYVQSLDDEKPSLSDTAKFLLRCALIDDTPFVDIDINTYRLNITDEYIKEENTRPFIPFLEFTIQYDDFKIGRDGNLNQYNQWINYYLPVRNVVGFLKADCHLNQEHDLPKFIRSLEKQDIANINSNFGTPSIQSIQISEPNSQNQTVKIIELQAAITRLQNELAEYELIKRHRKRAAEFNALIETLEHYASEYDSNKQPLKRKVAETFNRKAQLKEDNRRGEEAARILGLSEKNS